MSQVAVNARSAPAAGADPAVVQRAIREISHIATLPEITLKIIRLVEDPDSTAQDLNSVITHDPALGARILKVVNSAFYGLPGQIGSINRAIVLLGLNAVKNIAIAASLAKLFRGGQICPGFNAKDLWINSVAVGAATRLLAKAAGLGLPDEAFLAGLIHDLGIMVELQSNRAQFVKVIEQLQARPDLTLRQAELSVYGATHEDFGAALCKAWKFPLSFSYVTGFHHRPAELAVSNRRLTAMVHLAEIIAARLAIGFTRGVECQEISGKWLEELNLSPADVEHVSNELPQALEEARTLLQDSPS